MNQQMSLAQRNDEVFELVSTELGSLLPANIKLERFQAAFLTFLSSNRDVINCDPDSIRRELLKCAADGLVPDGRLAALVPFRDKDKPQKVAVYIPMVQGIIKRARELGDVHSLTCQVVRANDKFEWIEGDDAKIIHRPAALTEDRGVVVGAYVIFRDARREVLGREVMSERQINLVRNVSSAKDKVWGGDFHEEMCRKSVIRRGSKYIPMSDELARIIRRDDQFTDFALSNENTEPAIAGIERRLVSARTKQAEPVAENAADVIDVEPADETSAAAEQDTPDSAPIQEESGVSDPEEAQDSEETHDAAWYARQAKSCRGIDALSEVTDWIEDNLDDDEVEKVKAIFVIHRKRIEGSLSAKDANKQTVAILAGQE